MKSRVILLGSMLIFSSPLLAGVYMGTGAKEPANQTTLEQLAPPEEVAPQSFSYFGEEVITSKTGTPIDCEPYSGKGPMPAVPCPIGPVAVVVDEPFMVSVRDGSLKSNIDRITEQAGWERMVWKPEYDYNWVGNVTITASDIQGVLTKLLEPYPLQAVFYTANHVVEIVPRRNT